MRITRDMFTRYYKRGDICSRVIFLNTPHRATRRIILQIKCSFRIASICLLTRPYIYLYYILRVLNGHTKAIKGLFLSNRITGEKEIGFSEGFKTIWHRTEIIFLSKLPAIFDYTEDSLKTRNQTLQTYDRVL